jgi:hypothetical protein
MRGIAQTLAAIVAGYCVAGAAAGCGSSAAAYDVASPSASASVRSPQSLDDPRARILAAYTGMWQAFAASARTGDYQPGALQPYAAGEALSVLTHALYANYQQNVILRGAPALNPQVTQMTPASSPDSARVTDCASDAHWLQYTPQNRSVGGAAAGKHRIYAWLWLFSATWKVTEVVVEKAGTCA